ncbi:Unknown protein [Striga hermonthica]|uniref:Transposase-associated domain-containing protein n=1 Tax=Striga hermonthica TaxID=68872 RepID=A0A9N7NKF4_STRHE|nr:Unknown protein [Striga hermonthica]
MDRTWVNAVRTSSEYENGVEYFLEYAKQHVSNNNGKFCCPCVNCLNDRQLSIEEIREHVLCDGFNRSYTRWIWHGEFDMPSVSQDEQIDAGDADMYDRVEDIINDVGAEAFEQAHMNRVYESLSTEANKPLYNGCEKFSRLTAILKLINLKATHG